MSILGFENPYVTNALQMTGFTSGAQAYQASPYGGSSIYDNSYYNNNGFGTSAQGLLGMNVNAPANFAANLGGMFGPLQTTSFPADMYASYGAAQPAFMPTDPFSMMGVGGASQFGAVDPLAMISGGAQMGVIDSTTILLLSGLGGMGESSGSYSMLDLIRDVFKPILGIDEIEEKADRAYRKAEKAEKKAEKAEKAAKNADDKANQANDTANQANDKSTDTENKVDETINQLKTQGLKDLGVSEEEATKLLGISVVDADGNLLSDDQIKEKVKEVLGPSDTQIDEAFDVLKLDKAVVQKEALTDAGLTGFRTKILAVNIKNADDTMRTDEEIKADLRNLTHAANSRVKLTEEQIETALEVLKYEDADVEAARNQKLLDLGLSEEYAKNLQAISLVDGDGNARSDANVKDQMKRNFDIPYEVESIINTLKLGNTEA